MNKKHLSSIPRNKRLKRSARLQSARQWISSYTGRHIVKGYSRRKEKKNIPDEMSYIDCDENFSFIAGYTSGGAAFGIPWEIKKEEFDVADLPF